MPVALRAETLAVGGLSRPSLVPAPTPPAQRGQRTPSRIRQEQQGLGSWWSQTVTVGYERISGRRLPWQRADGSFTAGRSKTLAVDAKLLREALLDADSRADLLPGHASELRSRPGSRDLRLGIGPGLAILRIDTLADGRSKVYVEHNGLPDSDAVEYWRHWWGEWLEALEG